MGVSLWSGYIHNHVFVYLIDIMWTFVDNLKPFQAMVSIESY